MHGHRWLHFFFVVLVRGPHFCVYSVAVQAVLNSTSDRKQNLFLLKTNACVEWSLIFCGWLRTKVNAIISKIELVSLLFC
jgi:hypothetical protein